jgi:hypothetical protein
MQPSAGASVRQLLRDNLVCSATDVPTLNQTISGYTSTEAREHTKGSHRELKIRDGPQVFLPFSADPNDCVTCLPT